MSWTSSERLMYIQFSSCVQGEYDVAVLKQHVKVNHKAIFSYFLLTPLTFILSRVCTTKNTVISPDFPVWKFCVKTQFPDTQGGFLHKWRARGRSGSGNHALSPFLPPPVFIQSKNYCFKKLFILFYVAFPRASDMCFPGFGRS